MRLGESSRNFIRQFITVAIFILPLALWFSFQQASGDWGRSLDELLRFTSNLKQELPEYAASISEDERREQKYLLELIEETNPILLAALFAVFVLFASVLFMLTLIVFLLYLFFGLYLVNRSPSMQGSLRG